MSSSEGNRMKVTAIIPTYNGELWLPKSIPRVDKALKTAGVTKGEILVVDDGSTDDTLGVVKSLKTSYPLRVVSQENGGRFLARKTGALNARYKNLLYVDTRVFIGKDSLNYVVKNFSEENDKLVWNSHVKIDKKGNIYARFWDAIAYVAWRKYFSNPRNISYGIKEFDKYPKGTTCFFIHKSIMIEANEWFEKNTRDLKTSNDDTLLIRHIAERHNINLSPRFWCLYHSRSNLRQFTKHVFHRGKVFVDGFLRRDGNIFYYPLILFLFLSIIIPVMCLIYPALIIPLVLAGAVLWILEIFVLMILGTNTKDAGSLFILSPIFGIFYGLGIWSAFYKLYIRRIFKKRNL